MNTLGMRRALNLLELVIVVVIFGLLAAIAIPRLSSASPADAERSLRRDVSVLRSAIELYYRDHGAYPGQNGAGVVNGGPGTEAAFTLQLTRFSDADGRVADKPDEIHCYGPYLREGIPACSVAPREGKQGLWLVSDETVPTFTPSATEAGWVYNCETGDIVANSDRYGVSGARYDSY
jgi:prepilin-type N-terminal cleavage/methylation domain-containing protein